MFVVENPAGGKHRLMCQVCGQTGGTRRDVRDHVENSHFPNSFVYTCEHCGEQFKSKMLHRKHRSVKHRGQLNNPF